MKHTRYVIKMMTPSLLVVMFLFTFFSSILPFINIVMIQIIIDDLLRNQSISQLMGLAGITIGLNAALMLFIGGIKKIKVKKTTAFRLNFEKKLHFHQMNLSYQDLESHDVIGMQRDIDQTLMRNGNIEALVSTLENLMKHGFGILLSIAAFFRIFTLEKNTAVNNFWTSPYPLIGLFVVTIVSVIVTLKLQRRQGDKIAAVNQQVNEANGGAFQYMQLISDNKFGKDIRLYGLQTYLCETFNHLWTSSLGYRLTKKLGHQRAMIPLLTTFFDNVLIMMTYMLVIMKAIYKEITPGHVIFYVKSIQVFTSSIMALMKSFGDLVLYENLFQAYFDVLQIPEEERVEKNDLPKAPWTLTFEGVSFTYPNSKTKALKDVSFSFEPDKRLAIVGVNGSGKSTIIKLICRFYEPDEGAILLNGIDIRAFDVQVYRQLISAVFQDFSLLPLTLGGNVTCSNTYDAKEIEKTMKALGIDDLEDVHLYKDYEPNGREISGGEAQKIAIGRALYKDAPMVILDEPTAALDPRSEAEVYEKFDLLTKGKQTIFISHRLSSCQFCDDILVIHKGEIVQKGHHLSLVSVSGQYKDLWDTQAAFYQ